jgi:V/A-type H+-transporting ATPase subunit C
LTADNYWSLLESETVAQVAEKLKTMAYGDALSTLSAVPRRFEIEEAVKASLISQAENFLIYFSGSRKKFFRAWYAWYEAENLKSIFRYVAAGRMERDDLRRRLYPIKVSKVSFENLLAARNFSEVAEALRGSPFLAVLADPLHRLASGDEKALFPLEMALDGFVELALYKAMKKLDPDERAMLLPIFGSRIDLYNLYILYRAMTFYDMTPEETLNRLLPARHRISFSVLRDAVRLASLEQITDMIGARFPAFAELMTEASSEDAPQLAMERNIKRYIYTQCHKVFNSGSPDFHTAVSYFMLREYEISDITRVVEGVRYGYDRRKAAAYLVSPVVSGGESEWRY